MECNSQTCAFWIPLKARQKADINLTNVQCCLGLLQRERPAGAATAVTRSKQHEQPARAADARNMVGVCSRLRFLEAMELKNIKLTKQ